MRKLPVAKPIAVAIITLGSLVGIWALLALMAGLNRVDWQPVELMRQYMIATGMIKPIHTLVDFYSHIKGVEYLICVAFFVVFPFFCRYINVEQKQNQTRARIV